MIRGTTAQFKFDLPYAVDTLITARITFWQEGNGGPSQSRPLPIIKTLEQCDEFTSQYELYVTLNSEETLRFSDRRKAYVQLEARTIDGIKFDSKRRTVTVYPAPDDSILDDDIIPSPGPDNDFIILDGHSIA
jgi:hypothetical protein